MQSRRHKRSVSGQEQRNRLVRYDELRLGERALAFEETGSFFSHNAFKRIEQLCAAVSAPGHATSVFLRRQGDIASSHGGGVWRADWGGVRWPGAIALFLWVESAALQAEARVSRSSRPRRWQKQGLWNVRRRFGVLPEERREQKAFCAEGFGTERRMRGERRAIPNSLTLRHRISDVQKTVHAVVVN